MQLPVILGCFVVICLSYRVHVVSSGNVIPDRIGKVVIGFLVLTAGQFPSAKSGTISVTPFGIRYHVKNPFQKPAQPIWRTGQVQKSEAQYGPQENYENDDDVSLTSSEEDGVQNDHDFHKQALKKEDQIEKIKEDESDEVDAVYHEEDTFQKILVKELSKKLTRENKNKSKGKTDVEESEADTEGVVSTVTSVLKSILKGLADDTADGETESDRKSLGKSIIMNKAKEAQEKPVATPRRNRVKRQMSLSNVKLTPFYHVRDRQRTMVRPIPQTFMSPRPINQFGAYTRGSTTLETGGLAGVPWNSPFPDSSGSQPFGSIASTSGASSSNLGGVKKITPGSGTKTGPGSGVKVPGNSGAGNSGAGNSGAGNSGAGNSGENKKGSGGNKNNKNSGNKKPESSENESGEDESIEDDSAEEAAFGALPPIGSEEAGAESPYDDSSSNEINHDDVSGSDEDEEAD